MSFFGRYGFRNLNTFDQPNIPLPSGGAGNGAIYTRNRQAVFGTTWAPNGTSLLEARFGYSWTQAGKNPPALGTDSAQQQFGLPGLPNDPRISGGLPTILITGYSDHSYPHDLHGPHSRYIEKPFESEVLLDHVAELLLSHRPVV